MHPSVRAQVVTRRTYNRPKNDEGTLYETWPETVDRAICHQRWLWERAIGRELSYMEEAELANLRDYMETRQASLAGRTLWLGGTEVSRRREASQFNCAFLEVETVYDVVDALWLLLNGCGVGFYPRHGVLNGFSKAVPNLEVIRSVRTTKGGRETNKETWDPTTRTWTISVGDSAEAWAKSVGKLLRGQYPADKLVLDFSEIRPEGTVLKGYGWISSGDRQIARAYEGIYQILNRKAGQLLDTLDILDVMNWLGTVLSSRRSAEIALFPYGQEGWEDFAKAKKDHFVHNPQRSQSNNSLQFFHKPDREELYGIFGLMEESGGSEPGFVNAVEARRRAPWYRGSNPCGEILLGNKSFCNLVDINVSRFNGRFDELTTVVFFMARANYRQTCVDLDDGILQRTWHELNEYLRLCGVGLTGLAQWEYQDNPEYLQTIQQIAQQGANSMADELGLPRPKAVTTVKPSGTLSKIMDTTEGIHKPLGRYIFNNVNFSAKHPLVPVLQAAGYRTQPNPYDDSGVLVTFPVEYANIPFTQVDGKEVNLESAVEQLEQYRRIAKYYTDHNPSVTISYDLDEVPEIIDWLDKNWDDYVGVTFMYRNDPTKTAADFGYPYLPQEVVTQEAYETYVAQLHPVDIDIHESIDDIIEDECATGTCPIR